MLVSSFLEILNSIDFSAKKMFLEQFIDEPIKAIEEQISIAKNKLNENKANGLTVGEDLISNTSKNLKLVMIILVPV